MFDFKNSTKNFSFKNSLEVCFFSRTDWNFLIQEQTEILFNEQNFKHRLEANWKFYFKLDLNLFKNRLEVLIFFSLRSGFIRQLTSIKCSSLSPLMH